MLAWMAPPVILNHESMHNVWGMIEWSLNTTIFLLAGLIIGHRVLSKVSGIDWVYLIVFYIALMVIRFLTLFMLYPSIAYIGHRCTVKEAFFMSWAGLRGALGMALALIVENTCPNDIHDETSRLFFYVGGIAAMTLVINATTAKSLLFALGLLKSDSAEKLLVTQQIKRKLQRKTDKFIKQMAKDFEFTDEDIEEVRMSCTLLNDMDMPGLMRDTEVYPSNNDALPSILSDAMMNANNTRGSVEISGNSSSLDVTHNRSTRISRSRAYSKSSMKLRHMSQLLSVNHRAGNSLFIDELLYYVRSIFLEIVRVKYWHFIEEGQLPRLSFSAQYLLYSVDVALDQVSEAGARDWLCIEQELNSVPFGIQILRYYLACCPIHVTQMSATTLGFLEARQEKREVYMLSAFIEAHEHAQKKIHSFLGLDSNLGNTFDQGGGSQSSNRQSVSELDELPCPEEVHVIDESRKAVEIAKARLAQINLETVAAIRSKQAARLVLSRQADLVKTMMNEGLLTAAHAEEFLAEITRDTQRIEKERYRMYKTQQQKRSESKNNDKPTPTSSVESSVNSGSRFSNVLSMLSGESGIFNRKKQSMSSTAEKPHISEAGEDDSGAK
eukprot:gene33524-40559_t